MTSTKARILEDKKHTTGDGLENLIAELGTGQDKRSYSKFVNTKRLSANTVELNALYRTDWISGKVIDILPDDMTREWREFTGDGNIEALVTEEERLQVAQKFNLAHKWSRLYGTAFILMAVDDGQTPDKPLNMGSIRPGGLNHLTVMDNIQLRMSGDVPISDPFNQNYGYPEWYRISSTSVLVHHTRVLRFDAVMLPYDEFRRNNYNSDSVLDRMYEAITNYNTATSSAAAMIYETNVDVMKVRGLMNYLQTPEGEALLRKRFTLAGTMKSFNNMLLLDSEEDFQNKTNTFSGLPELIDRYAVALSASSDISATRLLGQSASGFMATGEGDLKNYYDKARSLQKTQYAPKLDILDSVMVKSLGMQEDTDTSYEFNSMFQMTPEQLATIEYTNAQRDDIYLNQSVVPISIVAKDLQKEGVYKDVSDEYIAELESQEAGEDYAAIEYPDQNSIENKSRIEEEQFQEGENSTGEQET